MGSQTVQAATVTGCRLRSGVLQVAVIETADGRGYVLTGTVTLDALATGRRPAARPGPTR